MKSPRDSDACSEMTKKQDDPKRSALIMDDGDQQLVRDLPSPGRTSKKRKAAAATESDATSHDPNLKKTKKRLRKKTAPTPTRHQEIVPPRQVTSQPTRAQAAAAAGAAAAARNPQTPKDGTKAGEEGVKPKPSSASKSAPRKKVMKPATRSLDVATDGYGILLHNAATESSSSQDLMLPSDAPILLPYVNAVGNETSNNVAEDVPHMDEILPASPLASSNSDRVNETVMLAPALVRLDSDSNTPSKEPTPEINQDGAANGHLVLGTPNLPTSSHSSESDAPTADEARPTANELPHNEDTDAGNATEAPSKEVGSPDDLTMSEVEKMFDADSPSHDEPESSAKMVVVDGFKVREQFEETARTILARHGDILAGTALPGLFHTLLMETVCGIYQTLDKSTFADLSLTELETIQKHVSDFGNANLNISWLAKRLDEIYDAKKSLQESVCMRTVNKSLSDAIEKELELQRSIVQKAQEKIHELEEKLKTEKADFETSDQAFEEAKRKALKFHKKSLLDGM